MNIQFSPRKKWLLFGLGFFLCTGLFVGGWLIGASIPRHYPKPLLQQGDQPPPKSFADPSPKLDPLPSPPKIIKQEKILFCSLLVEVLNEQGKSLPQAKVFIQEPTLPQVQTFHIGTFQPQKELGILSGSLPYPDDIILGKVQNTGNSNEIQPFMSIKKPIAETTTDEKGYARFTNIPPGHWQIIAQSPGSFAQTEIRTETGWNAKQENCLSQEDPHLVLSLRKTFSPPEQIFPHQIVESLQLTQTKKIEIEVVDSQNVHIPNVIVQGKINSFVQNCITNIQGKCLLSYDPTQNLTLEVNHSSFARFIKTYPSQTLEGKDALAVQLQKAGRIEGYVWDERTKTLLEPVRLALLSETQEQIIPVEKNGHFLVQGVPLGTISLQTQSTHYLSLKKDFSLSESKPNLREIRLELTRAGTLEGKIQGREGKIKIEIYDEQGILLGTTYSNSQGKYLFPALPPGILKLKVEGLEKEISVQIYPDHVQYEEIRFP